MKLAIPFGFTRALPSCYAIHPEFFSPGIDMKKEHISMLQFLSAGFGLLLTSTYFISYLDLNVNI
jgi:hypothetical protein